MNKDTEKIKESLLNEPSVILAYVFGSRIKGSINNRSDWDLGVYFTQKNLSNNPWHDFMLAAKLEQIVNAEVQIIVLNKPLTPLLGFEIVGKGQLLINKDDNLRLDYENRILRNYYDWNYIYKRSCKTT